MVLSANLMGLMETFLRVTPPTVGEAPHPWRSYRGVEAEEEHRLWSGEAEERRRQEDEMRGVGTKGSVGWNLRRTVSSPALLREFIATAFSVLVLLLHSRTYPSA